MGSAYLYIKIIETNGNTYLIQGPHGRENAVGSHERNFTPECQAGSNSHDVLLRDSE